MATKDQFIDALSKGVDGLQQRWKSFSIAGLAYDSWLDEIIKQMPTIPQLIGAFRQLYESDKSRYAPTFNDFRLILRQMIRGGGSNQAEKTELWKLQQEFVALEAKLLDHAIDKFNDLSEKDQLTVDKQILKELIKDMGSEGYWQEHFKKRSKDTTWRIRRGRFVAAKMGLPLSRVKQPELGKLRSLEDTMFYNKSLVKMIGG